MSFRHKHLPSFPNLTLVSRIACALGASTYPIASHGELLLMEGCSSDAAMCGDRCFPLSSAAASSIERGAASQLD